MRCLDLVLTITFLNVFIALQEWLTAVTLASLPKFPAQFPRKEIESIDQHETQRCQQFQYALPPHLSRSRGLWNCVTRQSFVTRSEKRVQAERLHPKNDRTSKSKSIRIWRNREASLFSLHFDITKSSYVDRKFNTSSMRKIRSVDDRRQCSRYMSNCRTKAGEEDVGKWQKKCWINPLKRLP